MGKGLGRENGVLVVCSAPKSMHHMCRAEFRVCVCVRECRELGVKRKRLCHIRFRLDGYNFFFRRRPINVSVARITQPSAEHEREPAVAAVPTLFPKLFPGFSLAFPLFFPLSLYTFTFVISVRLACKLLSDSCTCCPPARRA